MPQWHRCFLLAVAFHLQKILYFQRFFIHFALTIVGCFRFRYFFDYTSDKRNFIPHEIMMLFHMLSVWRWWKWGICQYSFLLFFFSSCFAHVETVVVETRYKLPANTQKVHNIQHTKFPLIGWRWCVTFPMSFKIWINFAFVRWSRVVARHHLKQLEKNI